MRFDPFYFLHPATHLRTVLLVSRSEPRPQESLLRFHYPVMQEQKEDGGGHDEPRRVRCGSQSEQQENERQVERVARITKRAGRDEDRRRSVGIDRRPIVPQGAKRGDSEKAGDLERNERDDES